MRNFLLTLLVFVSIFIMNTSDILAQQKCSPPSDLKAKMIGSSFGNIAWKKVSGSYGYKLRARVVGTADWSSMKILPTDSIAKISNLAPNSLYEMQILSYCNIDFTDTSAYSEIVNFHTNFPCESPSKLKTDSVTATTAVIHWIGPLNSVKFIVRYKAQGEKAKWENLNVNMGYSNSFKLTNLNPGTKYIWTISCKCAGEGHDDSAYAEPLGTFTTLIH